MPSSSNIFERLRKDPNVVYPLGNVPPNFNASANGNALSTPSTFLNNSNKRNDPNNSKNEHAPKVIGNPPSTHLEVFAFLQKLKKKNEKQK